MALGRENEVYDIGNAAQEAQPTRDLQPGAAGIKSWLLMTLAKTCGSQGGCTACAWSMPGSGVSPDHL